MEEHTREAKPPRIHGNVVKNPNILQQTRCAAGVGAGIGAGVGATAKQRCKKGTFQAKMQSMCMEFMIGRYPF